MINLSKVAVIIPTYNESSNIVPLVVSIFSHYPRIRVIVVDDNSPDGTNRLVRKLQNKYQQLYLINRTKDKGRGAACLAGFDYVLKNHEEVQYIIEMDADFSQHPKEINKLLAVADKETIVVGSRYVQDSQIINWPTYRLVLSKLANWYIRFWLKVPLSDYTSGFRCYSRKVLISLDFHSIKYKGFITLSETAYKLYQAGFRFREVPYVLKDRERGKSNATVKEIFRSFIAIIHIRMGT